MSGKNLGEATKMPEASRQMSIEIEAVWEGYRRWGYLAANLDPLGFLAPIVHPELVVTGETAPLPRFCGFLQLPRLTARNCAGSRASQLCRIG